MRWIFLTVFFTLVFCRVAYADKVTLDTGSTLEGILREDRDKVILQYISTQGEVHRVKSMEIPRARIKKIQYDPGYFKKYGNMVSGLGGAGVPIFLQGRPARADSLNEAIKQGNAQMQKNLQQEQEHMKHSKFYSGWHEGFHWDPNNGWHRWSHEGLYDPDDPNVTTKGR